MKRMLVFGLILGACKDYCKPTITQDCECSNGESGSQMCLSGGTQYGACMCNGVSDNFDAGQTSHPDAPMPVELFGIYEGETNYLEKQNWLLHLAIEEDGTYTGKASYSPTPDPTTTATLYGDNHLGTLTGEWKVPMKLVAYVKFQFVMDASSTVEAPYYRVSLRFCDNNLYNSCDDTGLDFKQVHKL